MAQREQQSDTSGRSMPSSYAPLNLENKLLAQSSLMDGQPCSAVIQLSAHTSPSLQPSKLSSTSSSLLSSSTLPTLLTSPLLSTQNKLLTSNSSFNDALCSTSLAICALDSRHASTASFYRHVLDEQQRDKHREEIPEVMHPEKQQRCEGGDDSAMESPVVEVNQKLEETLFNIQEEFAEFDGGKETVEEQLKDKKYLLLNAVCCSLVNKNPTPGQKDWDSDQSVWTRIRNLAKDISVSDPQFLLKVAVYTRQDLNVSITANFLLALAAHEPSTKPHIRSFFRAAVPLPSDWLEVAEIYCTCFSRSLPTCLKKAMTDRFQQFSEDQLAECDTRRGHCKHRHKDEKPTDDKLKRWADLVRAAVPAMKKFLQLDDSRDALRKQQRDFSMKKMIQRLHIKEPAQHVMAILGKKYPADLKAFAQSGMKGVWDSERAGQRMRLQKPEWKELLRLEGNKAATWEKLIDNNCLSFMAMMRNLKNLLTKGISEAHHVKILSRLTNKMEIVQSQQLPFRFLAAYKVVMELCTIASASQQPPPTLKEILKGILRRTAKSRQWNTTRRRIKATLGVPFICRLYQKKKAQLQKAKELRYTPDLLDRYRHALEAAFQISCDSNVPLLPGQTVILFHVTGEPLDLKLDFSLPPNPGDQNLKEKLTPSMAEVAVLLSLMIANRAEDCQVYAHNYRYLEKVELKSEVLLENVREITEQIATYIRRKKKIKRPTDKELDDRSFSRVLTRRNQVDTIIVVMSIFTSQDVRWAIDGYVKEINNKAVVMRVYLNDWDVERNQDPTRSNHVKLMGFNEQILRFVAARASARLLDHVETLDQVYNIPRSLETKGPQTKCHSSPLPKSPGLKWRCVRVFISSAHKDMHAERDMLLQGVFPELRRRAASHCLYLQEVELRWGVTEEELGRATELCLSEVCRSQMMVGILGERYGLVPPTPTLPDLPQYSWLKSAPPGLSITEMEMRQFQALHPNTVHKRMFCYFRDPSITRSVPVAWRSHFVSNSEGDDSKLTLLKSWIKTSGIKVTENYPCEWGGVVGGNPYLKNLEGFSEAVIEDLSMAIMEEFVKEKDEPEAASDVAEQEVHQGALHGQFFSPTKLLSEAVETVEQVQTKGGPEKSQSVATESLQNLSQPVIKSKLVRLLSQFDAVPGLRWALGVLTVSTPGLRGRDFFSVLNTCTFLSSRNGRASWQEVLQQFRKPEGRVPMTTFTRLVQTLQRVVDPSLCPHTTDLLALTHPHVIQAFQDVLLPAEGDRTKAYFILAASLWGLADPEGTDTFLHCEASCVMRLPSSLIQSGQLEALHSLLCSYYFMYANIRHGLLQHLLRSYSDYGSLQDGLEDCHRFLQHNAAVLSSWPTLFIQQALNEPPDSSAHTWAQGLLGKRGGRVIEWLNRNDRQKVAHTSKLLWSFSSEPTCLSRSSDGELIAVGTKDGSLLFINADTGETEKMCVSSYDGVSSCVFLEDRRLALTSFDGHIEIWDFWKTCRAALIKGHSDAITGSDVTTDRKHFATVSLDFMLKVWSSTKGSQVAALPSPSPLNCVTFDPEGHLLAAGCWDGNVIVWNWFQNKKITSLSGHQRSVRSLCFSSSSSSMLCSGSVSGEVRMWVVSTSTCVGCFQAHYGAVQALTFLNGGTLLLSAGSDHMLHLWSGGLGSPVVTFKHINTFQGHGGEIRGVSYREGFPEFLTVSEDCCLHKWTLTAECPRSPVAALCFSETEDLLLAGYDSGLLELWQNNRFVCQKQASGSSITAICSMPDEQFAVSSVKCCVDVWRLEWDQQHSSARLVKVNVFTVAEAMVHLAYCSVLIGVSQTGVISEINHGDKRKDWFQKARILEVIQNDEKSLWLVGEKEAEVRIGFVLAMGPRNSLESAFSWIGLPMDEEMKRSLITAATIDKDFVVCGDTKGYMWFNQHPEVLSWSSRKPAHSDRISVLKLTDRSIISASYDRTVKLWDRNTKKQVGMFVCGGPVLFLELNPQKPSELVCGDRLGKLYFLSWRDSTSRFTGKPLET